MPEPLDRQEVIAVLDLQEVGARGHRPEEVPSYREVVADALMALVAPVPVSVQVRCTDMEDYARIHNVGFGEAVEQFGELLGDARQDLASEASAGDLLAWLNEAVKAMGGGGHDDARLGLVTDGGQGLGTCSTQPAEPARVVTDEAVEAACERMCGSDVWQRMHASEQESKRAWMRFALEAATPLLVPRPLLDREAVRRALVRSDYNPDAALPDAHWVHAQQVRGLADAVMELARPMPTDVQIHEAIDSALDSHAYDNVPIAKITVALLALLNGAES